MTKNELEQLLNLRKEIKELDLKIERFKSKYEKSTDRVHCSMQDFPYAYTTKTITGIAEGEKKKMLTEQERLLLVRRRKLVSTETKITQYINEVEDAKIRRIMELRYEQGMTWEEVADEMNYHRTYPEKMLKKYLDEHPEKKIAKK